MSLEAHIQILLSQLKGLDLTGSKQKKVTRMLMYSMAYMNKNICNAHKEQFVVLLKNEIEKM